MTGIRLQTRVKISPPSFALGVDSSFCCMGSCFADHLTNFLERSKFDVSHNPAGITYNPVSLAHTLFSILANHTYQVSDLIESDFLFHSMDHHGSFSGSDPKQVINRIHDQQQSFKQMLFRADALIMTLGTAHVFRRKSDGRIVNNCHKLPNHKFIRQRIAVSQVVEPLSKIFEEIWMINPKIQIVLSVSPVRHIRDGLIENQRSKATLILAAAQLSETYDQVTYFPAFEIMTDDLRDYRFYKEDLIHPSDLAVKHIIDRFVSTFFHEDGQQYIKRIASLNQSLNHRPLHPKRKSHQEFLSHLVKDIEHLQEQYPNKDFRQEHANINQQLNDA